MPRTNYFRGDMSKFRSSTPQILWGDILNDVKKIEHSIKNYGMLSPLVVARNGTFLMVIDGRKRLAALRRMHFQGQLPRDLVSVPYIIVNNARERERALENDGLALLSNREKFDLFRTARQQGSDLSKLAAELYIKEDVAKMFLSLPRLSERVMTAFLSDTLSLKQVDAYARLRSEEDQDRLLMEMGPFAKPSEIITVIASWDVRQKNNQVEDLLAQFQNAA